MNPRIKPALLAAVIALAAPTMLAAQDAEPEPAVPDPEQLQEVVEEYQELHQQLEGIQMQALQDPQLSTVQEEIGDEIRQAMETSDPTMDERVARAEELESEAEAAQEDGDAERFQELVTEAQEIEQHLMSLQQSVMERPELAGKIGNFQEQLQEKMLEVDPNASGLMDRFQELELIIAAAMSPGQS